VPPLICEFSRLLQINTYFDHVYVLNLNSDKLRLKEVSGRLKKLGINFLRFPAVDGRELEFSSSDFTLGIDQQVNKFELACRLSHFKIIENAKRNGFTKVLIFEDDVFFFSQFNIHLQSLRDLLDWKLRCLVFHYNPTRNGLLCCLSVTFAVGALRPLNLISIVFFRL